MTNGPAERKYSLSNKSDRAAINALIKEKMKSAGVNFAKASALVAASLPFEGKEATIMNDRATRAALHAEALRRVHESPVTGHSAAGAQHAASFADALNSVFADLSQGKTVKGIAS